MNFFETSVSQEAIDLVVECMKSTRISAGGVASNFEKELESTLNIKNVVTVNSGTSALHLALECANIKTGDEVILPAQTFISTGLSILYTGATPVFCDISVDDGNIDVSTLEQYITPNTKAIIPVHWGGYPCDMDEILRISNKYNLVVIEDAAHAIGATYKTRPIGTLSNFTCFSFQAIKHLTCSDGGAISCLNESDYNELKRRRWFDIDRDNTRVGVLGERVYDATHVGYKYHMNDFCASMGLGNLKNFHKNLARVREIADIYTTELASVVGLSLMKYKSINNGSYWLYPITVMNRINFISKMNSFKIPVSVVHQGIDRYSVFPKSKKVLVNQRKFDESQIHIPIHCKLTDDDVSTIINAIKSGW